MNALEVRTIQQGQLHRNAKYQHKVQYATVFLRHSEDRIHVKAGEEVEVQIYDNDTLVFSGSKTELFTLLKEVKR